MNANGQKGSKKKLKTKSRKVENTSAQMANDASFSDFRYPQYRTHADTY